MDADWQTIENKQNITPTFGSLYQKMNTEAEADTELISFIKIENTAISDEIEFQNCNVKEEIPDEMGQPNDPLKVVGFNEIKSEKEQIYPIFTSNIKLEQFEENIFLEQSSNYHNTNIDDDSINVEENYESENIFLTCRICGFCFL